MTREIKFRVWDKQTRQMVYIGGLAHLEISCGGTAPVPYHIIPATNEVMQYTGLKDKNGKEIYESDFVLCPEWEDYDKGIMGMVKREVRWDNSDACFAAFLEGEPDREGYMLDNASNMEVVGNKYEG